MADMDEEDYLESLLKSMNSGEVDEDVSEAGDESDLHIDGLPQDNNLDNIDNFDLKDRISDIDKEEIDLEDADSRFLSSMLLSESTGSLEDVQSEEAKETEAGIFTQDEGSEEAEAGMFTLDEGSKEAEEADTGIFTLDEGSEEAEAGMFTLDEPEYTSDLDNAGYDIRDAVINQDIQDISDIQEVPDVMNIQDTDEMQDVNDIQDTDEMQDVNDIQDTDEIQDVNDIQDTVDNQDIDMDDTSIDDLLNALQTNSFNDDEETDIDSGTEPDILNNGGSDILTATDAAGIDGNNNDFSGNEFINFGDDLTDILALDDGLNLDGITDISGISGISDITDNNFEGSLTEEENEHIDEIVKSNEKDSEGVDNDGSTPEKKNRKGRKDRKKDKKSAKDEEGDSKKTGGLKNFFMKFDDSDEVSTEHTKANKNQQIIDEVYGSKDSLADEEINPKKGSKKKKEKKVKEKKVKKEKPVKEKKIKESKPVSSKMKLKKGTLFKVCVIVGIVCAGIVIASRLISYNISMKNSKELFARGSYTSAYEMIYGLDIKAKDEDYYEKARIMASLYQGMESYENYIEMGNTTNALVSLVNAVSRKYIFDEQIIKYNIEIPAETIYTRMLLILDKYGISEQMALDFNSITNYNEFISKISAYGGEVE